MPPTHPPPNCPIYSLNELKEYGHRILEAVSFADGLANILSDASIAFMLVDWTLGKNTTGSHQQAIDLLTKARARNAKLPIFLMLDRKVSHTIPLKVGRVGGWVGKQCRGGKKREGGSGSACLVSHPPTHLFPR